MNAEIRTAGIKTVLTGLAGYYVFGARAGLGAAVAQGGISLFAKHTNQKSWLVPGSSLSQAWPQLRRRIKGMAISQVRAALFVLAAGQMLNQNAIHYVRWAFRQGPLEGLKAVGSVCIFGPVAEEIFFRGFVQEAIQAVQSEWKGSAANSKGERKLRIWLQAILFGFAHYSARQGRANGYIILGTALMGGTFGWFKETHGIHASMLLHSVQNSLVTARVAFVGG